MRKYALPSFDKWSFFSQIFLGFLLWGSFSHAQPQIAQPLGPDNTLANSSLATVRDVATNRLYECVVCFL